MKKRIIYILDNNNKALSDLLNEKYNVTTIKLDKNNDLKTQLEEVKNNHYDILVACQILPDLKLVNSLIKFENGVIVQSQDNFKIDDKTLFEYKDFNIINFSKELDKKLIKFGLSAYLPQDLIEAVDLIEAPSRFNLGAYFRQKQRLSVTRKIKLFGLLTILGLESRVFDKITYVKLFNLIKFIKIKEFDNKKDYEFCKIKIWRFETK